MRGGRLCRGQLLLTGTPYIASWAFLRRLKLRVIPALFVGLVAFPSLWAPHRPSIWLPKAADMIGSAPVCGTTGVIGIGATASPMDVTTTVQMRYGIRPKAGWPYRIRYLA
jgi:hypothetical protein